MRVSPSANVEKPEVTFAADGPYTLTLTADDNDPGTTDDENDSITVVVLENPIIDSKAPTDIDFSAKFNSSEITEGQVILFGEVNPIEIEATIEDADLLDEVILALKRTTSPGLDMVIMPDVTTIESGSFEHPRKMTITHTLPTTSLIHGDYELKISATDRAGNTKEESRGFKRNSYITDFTMNPTLVNDETNPAFTAAFSSGSYDFDFTDDQGTKVEDVETNTGTTLASTSYPITLADGKYRAKLAVTETVSSVTSVVEIPFAVRRGSETVPLKAVAEITNVNWNDPDDENVALEDMQLPFIEEGLFELKGRAGLYTGNNQIPADDVEYMVTVDRRNVTPGNRNDDGYTRGSSNGESLGVIDLTDFVNDRYEMVLDVRVPNGGDDGDPDYLEDSDRVKFILNAPLKIGHVKFSQEDLTIPVGGIPLTIVRTYDGSRRHEKGDFGYGWTYSLANLDIDLHESRTPLGDDDDDETVRSGGAYDRDVTMTLPNGERTTFAFYLEVDTVDGFNFPDKWKVEYVAPKNSKYSLQTMESVYLHRETLNFVIDAFTGDEITLTSHFWEQGDERNAPVGTEEGEIELSFQDFSGYKLTDNETGTEYYIDRKKYGSRTVSFGQTSSYEYQHYGKPYVSKIVMRNGDTLKFKVVDTIDNGIPVDGEKPIIKAVEFYPGGGETKAQAIEIISDPQTERILAINAPSEEGEDPAVVGDTPTVKYEYDHHGNLVTVKKLVDKNGATEDDQYDTITYSYSDERFRPVDHYVTNIRDPRGQTPIRYVYDEDGRLTGTIDARGYMIRINHDTVGNTEKIIDRNGNVSEYIYDMRGNVVQVKQLDSENHNITIGVTNYDYKINGEVDEQNPDSPKIVSVQTKFDDPLTTGTDESEFSDTETRYDSEGRAIVVIDPVSNVTTNKYDAQGNLVLSTQWRPNNPASPVTFPTSFDSVDNGGASNYTEVSTTRNTYNGKGLLITSGVTKTEDSTINWYSATVNYYDDKNRLTDSVTIDVDNIGTDDLTDPDSFESPTDLDEAEYHTKVHYEYDDNVSATQPAWITSIVSADTTVYYDFIKTHFRYDDNERQEKSWTKWDDPSEGTNDSVNNENDTIEKSIYSFTFYDDQGRVIYTAQQIETGNVDNASYNSGTALLLSQTFYNSIGQVQYSIDQNGNVTENRYDPAGNVVEVATWHVTDTLPYLTKSDLEDDLTAGDELTVSQTLYNPNGQVILSVDTHEPGSSANGTETVYDDKGQVVETRRWEDVAIRYVTITGDDDDPVVLLESDYQPKNAWASQTEQNESEDALAWVVNATDAGGPTEPMVGGEISYTRNEYDAAGRLIKIYVLDDLGGEFAQTEYLYDAAGKQVEVKTLPGSADETSTTTEYEGNRRKSVTDANGETTSFEYDALGRVIRTELPSSTFYDPDSIPPANVTSETYLHVGYDGLGRKEYETKQTDEDESGEVDGDTETRWFEYDLSGRLTQVDLYQVDLNPHGTPADLDTPIYTYIYDDYGNQVGILDNDGVNQRLTVFKYDHLHRQVAKYMPFIPTAPYDTITDAASVYLALANQSPDPDSETRSYYDDGRLKTISDYEGQVTEFVYDDRGRLEFKKYYASGDYGTNPPAEGYEYHYDDLGRNDQVDYLVDNSGQLEFSETDKQLTFDVEGRVLSIESPQGMVRYEYNPITGRKLRTAAGDGENSSLSYVDYDYDDLGRLDSVQPVRRNGLPITVDEITSYTYDDNGNRATMTLGNGSKATYGYDALNRLTSLSHDDSTMPTAVNLADYTYTLLVDGMRCKAEEDVLPVTGAQDEYMRDYGYDALNRLIREESVDDNDSDDKYISEYTYDLAGNRVERKVKVPGGGSYYDRLITSYSYDAATDRLLSEVQSFDDDEELISMNLRKEDVYPVYVASNDGGAGQVVWQRMPSKWWGVAFWSSVSLVPAVMLLGLLGSFTPRGQRVGRRVKGAFRRSISWLLVFAFIVSPFHLQVMADNAAIYSNLETNQQSIWGATNRKISYTYDKNGALTEKLTEVDSSGVDLEKITYAYNLQGRLVRMWTDDDTSVTTNDVDVVDYSYNTDGIRVSKYSFTVAEDDLGTGSEQTNATNQVTTDYLIDPSNHTGYAQVIVETTVTADPPNDDIVDRTSYVIGHDVIAQAVSTDIGVNGTPSWGTAEYLLYDGHGSTRQLQKADETILEVYAYDAYGVNLDSSTSSLTSLQYAGEMWDNDAGHYYNRARWYNPANGRFNRVDPFAGFNRDPQSLHKYIYVHNNPINGTDPSGLLQLIDVLSALGIRDIVDTIKSSKELAIKKGVRQSFNELRDAFSMEDQKPLTKVAIAAEMLWVTRMRALGLNVIAMQSWPVGTHGPDLLAFGMIKGEFKIIVGEVKGMKSSKVLSSLNKLSDGMLQMSSNWIDTHFSKIVNAAAGAIFEAIGGNIPDIFKDQVESALESFNFEYYLLRARRFTGNEWTLRGFRLLHIEGDNDMVGLNKEPLDQRIEMPFKTPGPPGF